MSACDNLSDLLAFSPTGAAVAKTFECSTSTHNILYFHRVDGDKYVHEFGDDSTRSDCDTVSIDGHVIYVDANGVLWPEPALTYRTQPGEMVRRGVDMPPIKWPNLNRAVGFAVKADRLTPDAVALTEGDWVRTALDQGWSDASRLIHLEGLIREMGLMPVLAAYAMRAAAEENAMASSLDAG